MKNTVNIAVSIDQFDTDVLITTLYNRIYDYIHDEEPQSDAFLEPLSSEWLFILRTTLNDAIRERQINHPRTTETKT